MGLAKVYEFPVATESRPVQTVYYRGRTVIQTNRAKWANSAVLRCIDHMQLNSYGATVAEVYDSNTGELHAVITHSVTNKITIVFKREVDINEKS